MFASENGESRLTSTYAMTLSFHPRNKVEYSPCACMGGENNEKRKKMDNTEW